MRKLILIALTGFLASCGSADMEETRTIIHERVEYPELIVCIDKPQYFGFVTCQQKQYLSGYPEDAGLCAYYTCVNGQVYQNGDFFDCAQDVVNCTETAGEPLQGSLGD